MVIVPDTSAWIEVLRATGSAVDRTLTELLTTKAPLGVTEYVVLEVLAGARSDRHLGELRSQLFGLTMLTLNGLADYEEAATLYRACRRGGETIRELNDCLVAVPVIREGAHLLHNDSDFDAIARHSELHIYPVDGG